MTKWKLEEGDINKLLEYSGEDMYPITFSNVEEGIRMYYESTKVIYVDTVRKNCEIMSLEKAVESAVDECISNGILREFLMNNKAEVTRMSIFEYDEELNSRTLLEEGIEIGMERGKLLVARKMLDKGMTMQEVVEITGLSEEEIELQ